MGEVLREAWFWILVAIVIGLVIWYFLRTRGRAKAGDSAASAVRNDSAARNDSAVQKDNAAAAAPLLAEVSGDEAAQSVSSDAEPVVATPAKALSGAAAAKSGAKKAPAKAAATKTAAAKAGASKTAAAKPAAAKPAAAKAVASKTAAAKPAAAKPAAAKAGASKAGASKTAAAKPAAAKPAAAASDLAKAADILGKKIKQDDLTVVEGIGPKIAGLLKESGVSTWAQLAEAKQADLQAVLEKAGPRYNMHKPDSWPKQAALLNTGKWAQFKKLTDELTAGR